MTKQVEATIEVSNGIDSEHETLFVRQFPDNVEPARATISIQMPYELRKYHQMKLFASVTIPCYEEEIEAALDKAQGICENRVNEMYKKIKDKRHG